MERSGRLTGRVALVTGGAGGIGRACAERFAREGADVAVADRERSAAEAAADALRDTGVRCEGFGADLADPGAVEALVAAVLERFGAVDVLHSNAGVIRYAGALEHTIEDWDRTYAVNVRAAFLLARAILPGMLDRGHGVQLFTASTSGWAGDPELPAYCSSKAALINLTRQLSTDFAGRGVRFVCLNPGWIDTGFDLEAMAGTTREELDAAVREEVPMRRWGRPEEVAAAAAFLASDDAAYITGTTLDIDGGGAGKG